MRSTPAAVRHLFTRGLALCLALAVVVLLHSTDAAQQPQRAKHPHHRRRVHRFVGSAPRALLARTATHGAGHAVDEARRTVSDKHETLRATASRAPLYPTDFGADPTGRRDSTTALRKCIEVCLNQSALSPNGLFPGSRSFGNGKAVRDMGGCHIDLAGGEYLISAPLVFPEYNANLVLGGGSLVAASTFSAKGSPSPDVPFMIIVGVHGSCKVPQGSCNIDLNFPDLFMDGSHVASAMQINNVMGVTIGPGGYFLNFTAYGLQINQGHEVMVERCWLGETNFDFDHTTEGRNPNATAIQINGNDHYILNSIVFSSKVGVEVNGAADYVQGVHVWFPLNRALAFKDQGVMAFHVTGGGNRFNGCYIDGGRAVFEGSGLTRNTWTNGFDCCAGAGLGQINHGIILAGNTVGPGLHITHNQFGGGSVWHEAAPSQLLLVPASASASESCGASRFPVNVSGVQCQGLVQASAAGAEASAAACRQACCDLQAQGACSIWQWCDPAQGDGCGCWLDPNAAEVSCGLVKSGGPWVGGALAPPPVPSTGVVGVRIEDNDFSTGSGVGSRASLFQTSSTPRSTWSFDFCAHLVFKQIALVRAVTVTPASANSAGGVQTSHVLAGSCALNVTTSPPTAGTVFVEVDSSTYHGSFV